MPSSNILLFDENKSNMKSDGAYSSDSQRLNGVQSGIASSELQNKTLYQVSLIAYAIAQLMQANGYDANDSDQVATFVSNLSDSIVQKVADKATNVQVSAGTDDTKYITPAKLASIFPLGVDKGGTGRATLTSNAVLTGNGANLINMVAAAKGALYSTGSGVAPTFGTLPVAEGGTGKATLTSGSALVGNGTSAVSLRPISNTDSLSSGSTNLVTENAVVGYVGNQIKASDNWAPQVGDVLLDPSVQTTEELARPYYYQKYGSTIGSCLVPWDSGETNNFFALVFKNKYCAGKRLKITWHCDQSLSALRVRAYDSYFETGIPENWTNYYWEYFPHHLNWSDLYGSSSGGASIVANASQVSYYSIPAEYYTESFVYLNVRVKTTTNFGSSLNPYVIIDQIEIVD